MIQSKLIGLTGGICTGKSTVTEILRHRGYTVVDADRISKNVLDRGTLSYKRVVDEFGEGILNPDKTINRRLLGEIIFKDQCMRKKLNSITHPHILKEISLEIKRHRDEEVIFLDLPLLFELRDDLLNYDIEFDEIWLVYVDRDTQLKRLIKRDNIDLELAEFKINSQIDIEEKKRLSDVLIDNRGTREELVSKVESILKDTQKN